MKRLGGILLIVGLGMALVACSPHQVVRNAAPGSSRSTLPSAASTPSAQATSTVGLGAIPELPSSADVRAARAALVRSLHGRFPISALRFSSAGFNYDEYERIHGGYPHKGVGFVLQARGGVPLHWEVVQLCRGGPWTVALESSGV